MTNMLFSNLYKKIYFISLNRHFISDYILKKKPLKHYHKNEVLYKQNIANKIKI